MILDELKQLCPSLTGLENKMPYIVSPGYFENLPHVLLGKVSIATSLIGDSTIQNPYTTPEGYFENLSSVITTRVRIESTKEEVFNEMENLFPLLNTLTKQPVFSIPKNYFTTLEPVKPLKIVEKTKVTYFELPRKFMSYAAAAVVTGVLAVGIFFFIGKTDRNAETELTNSGSLYTIKTLSEQEIINFLKTTSPQEHIVTNIINGNKSGNKNGDIKKLISEMSDKEIKQFLRENGEDVDM